MIKSIYFWGILIVVAFLFFSLGLFGGNPELRHIQIVLLTLQLIVLTVTAAIVFFYTYETHKMRKEMVNQTKIHSSPFISAFIGKDEKDTIKTKKIWVRNDGEGTARNIQIKALKPLMEDAVVSFQALEVLQKGEKRELRFEMNPDPASQVPGASPILNSVFIEDLEKRSVLEEFPFELKFKNILEVVYRGHLVFKDGQFFLKNL